MNKVKKKSINMKHLTHIDIIIAFSLLGCQIMALGGVVHEVTLATSLEKCRHVMFDQGLHFQNVFFNLKKSVTNHKRNATSIHIFRSNITLRLSWLIMVCSPSYEMMTSLVMTSGSDR